MLSLLWRGPPWSWAADALWACIVSVTLSSVKESRPSTRLFCFCFNVYNNSRFEIKYADVDSSESHDEVHVCLWCWSKHKPHVVSRVCHFREAQGSSWNHQSAMDTPPANHKLENHRLASYLPLVIFESDVVGEQLATSWDRVMGQSHIWLPGLFFFY